MITVKIENKPQLKDTSSYLVLEFKLNPINIGNIGSIHGDNIEITPVKKKLEEINPFKSL